MDVKEQFGAMQQQISSFFSFVGSRLENFTSLSLGEKIAYPAVGLGIVLTITSIIMFVL
jgi:hypothetical protein